MMAYGHINDGIRCFGEPEMRKDEYGPLADCELTDKKKKNLNSINP